MERLQLTADELLAGSDAIYDIAVPGNLISPGQSGQPAAELIVKLRPINIGQFSLIMKAAKDDAALIPLLLVKESLVEPEMPLNQIKQLSVGLVGFLVEQIRAVSGLTKKKSP